jgi:hypothetical protein
MKTFQKITLAAAISAAPFMSQAMEALDDTVLGNTTGQAGVTIEIDLGDNGIKVGSVVYTDTAHQVVDVNGVAPGESGYIATTEDGGSVALENINVNLTGKLVQTIDVSENGDLEMTMSSPGALTISMGNDAADTTGQFSALKLVGGTGNDSELINNLDLSLNLGNSTTTIMNLGGTTQDLVTVPAAADRTGLITDPNDAGFDQAAVDAADAQDAARAVAVATNTQITKLNAVAPAGLGLLANAGVTGSYANDVSSMAIKMNASIEITDMNLGAFGYTEAQAGLLVNGKADQYAALYANASSPEAKAALAASYGDADGNGSITGAELSALKDKIATSSAVQVEGVTVAAASGGAIELNQVIWAVGGDASLEGSKAGVYIQLGAMDMNIGVADIKIGNGSIGSLAINGLEMNGMTQRIYGH